MKVTDFASMSFVLLLALSGCDGGGSNDNQSTDNNQSTDSNGVSSVQGESQKGPFQSGGTAIAVKLNADGTAGSDQVSGTINENGEYQLTGIDWGGATEILMEGTFYNEVSGTFSSQTRSLSAVTHLSEGELLSSNVNLFTHILAARVKFLMNDGVGGQKALNQARADIKTALDLNSNPADLNLLETTDTLETDSANLLVFSAASLKAGVGEDGLDALAADFADDGEFNGNGVDELANIKDQASDSLLTSARMALQNQYSTIPPNLGSAGSIGWQLPPCVAAKLDNPRVFCIDETFNGTKGADEGEPILFYPPEDGYYAISLAGDAASGLAGWTLFSEDFDGSEVGDSSAASFPPYEDATTFSLDGGDPYAVRVNLDAAAGADDSFRLGAHQLSEGAGFTPIEVEVGEHHDGRVGSLFTSGTAGGPATSWYRFHSAGGSYRIEVSGHPLDSTNSDGGLRIQVYQGATDQVAINNLNALTQVDFVNGNGGSSNSLTVSLEAGKPHFVLITNLYSDFNRSFTRPEVNWVEYDLHITKP